VSEAGSLHSSSRLAPRADTFAATGKTPWELVLDSGYNYAGAGVNRP